MALFERSSCEDSVDRFNHTWLVIFLLILAAFTFFLPFGFPLSGRGASSGERLSETLQKYTVNCWCPAEFTGSMVEYTNAACGAAFMNAQRGSPIESDNENNTASLYLMPNESDISQRERYAPDRVSPSKVTEEFNKQEQIDALYFLFNQTPLFLFVCAICFKCIHTLFLIFVSWYGVNVSNLILTWQNMCMDVGRSDQLKQDFVHVVSSKLKSSRWLSVSYLMYKIVLSSLCLIIFIVIYCYLMPSALLSERQLSTSDQSSSRQFSPKYKSIKLLCEFSVLIFQRRNKFAVQCMFTHIDPTSLTVQSTEDEEVGGVSLYTTLYSALLFTFIIITVVNTLNLILWIVKLCRCECMRRHTKNLSLDARLLVCLMEEHADYTAAKKMEKGLADVQNSSESFITFTKETGEF